MSSWKPNVDLRNPSEEVLLSLAADSIRPAKLTMTVVQQQTRSLGTNVDAVVDIEWHSCKQRYACEIKRANTPRTVEGAIAQALFAARASNLRPMILVPYLSEEKLQAISDHEVSALDACGNAFIQSDQFLFWRSGQPNRFKMPSPHLNPFRGDNSIFSRCFLLQREFDSLSDLREFATDRMGGLSGHMERELLRLGTASKTVQALEEQLIVQKTQGVLKLLDHRKLLTQLKLNYQAPISRKITGKIPFDRSAVWEKLRLASESHRLRFAATGYYSASHYGVLSPSEKLSIYVDDLPTALSALEFSEAKAFANCELIETKKNFPFFDLKRDNGIVWASLVQTWLELANGNSREQEAGQDLERMILQGDSTK
jgi:hypothetical protein